MAWSLHDGAIEHLARLGYGARGVVYCLVGVLALLAAMEGSAVGDSESALRVVLGGPFGAVLVALIALGLFGFALWRAFEAVTDADDRGRDARALAVRAAHLVSGATYAGLALSAASLAIGLGRASAGGDGVKDGTAWLLQQPFGPWLVGLAGLAAAGVGIGYGAKAWQGDVADRLSLPAGGARWARPMGRLGYAARGIVFLIIGGFILTAAWTQTSSDARGLSGAFEVLRQRPFGWALLAGVAIGHFAFGTFGLVQARYRRIDAPNLGEADTAVARSMNSLP